MQATSGKATFTDKILEKLAARLAEETKGEARFDDTRVLYTPQMPRFMRSLP